MARNPDGRFHDEAIKTRVMEALDEVRQAIRMDGGDVELVDVIDGVVQVRLVGACCGCSMSQTTLTYGIENVIKEKIPEVIRVEAVP